MDAASEQPPQCRDWNMQIVQVVRWEVYEVPPGDFLPEVLRSAKPGFADSFADIQPTRNQLLKGFAGFADRIGT